MRAAVFLFALTFFYSGLDVLASAAVYTDHTEWLGNTLSLTDEGFDSVTTDTEIGGTTSNPFPSGVTITSTSIELDEVIIDAPVVGSNQYRSGASTGPGFSGTILNLNGLDQFDLVNINLPTPSTAMGIFVQNYDFDGDRAQVFVNGEFVGAFPERTGAENTFGFLGITSDTPFDVIQISTPTDSTFNAIDGLSFGVAVPEPSSTVVFVLALGCCMFRGRGTARAYARS